MDIHHYIHVDPQFEVSLRSVHRKLDLILRSQEAIMATVAENLDVAEAAMKANTDAEDSIILGFNAVRAEIAALKQAGTDPATAARIEALSAALSARTPILAAAAVANTPAA